jgi:superfamily I DNA/RNA helicase
MAHLDPKQAAAAKSAAEIQLTMVGPGASKTSTLAGRFLYLVRKGAEPARIPVMAYTKKVAER